MKEMLDRALAYGPDFLDRFLRLLTSPKTFLAEISLTPSRELLQQAVVFYLCCTVIVFLLEWPLSESNENITFAIVISMILHLSFTLILSAVFLLVFRVLRGHVTFVSFFTVTLYINAVGGLIWALMAPVSKGIVVSNDPDLYPRFKDLMDRLCSLDVFTLTQDHYALFQHTSVVIGGLSSMLIVMVGTVWIITTWGAYRRLSGVGRLRSLLAFILVQLAGGPLLYLFGITQRALKVNLF